MHRRAAAIVLLLAVVACSSGGDDEPEAQQASSTSSSTTTTEPPTTTTTTEPPRIQPAPALPATADCPAVPGRRSPDPRRPRYRIDATFVPASDAVPGGVVVQFTPDLPTDRLVFRLWPNGPRARAAGAALRIGPVAVDGDVVEAQQPDPTTLVVPLDGYVDAGTTVEATVAFTLDLPGDANDRIARYGDTVRLGSWFPILAWEPGTGWAEDPATGGFAEASTAPTADFSLAMAVPDGLQVLASGEQQPDGRWRADAVRDVAVSIGRFRTVTGTADGGVAVTVGASEGVQDDPQAYLDKVVASLNDFHRRFGPYPWPTLSLALTPGLGGGIEYPAHILQGPGTIGRTTPHEVGHMWFYGLVGNNQGRDPWLDEGLATWAEARFLDTLGTIEQTSVPSGARNQTGRPMTYWESRQAAYYRGVYVQGAQVLADLGDPDRVDCALRHYVARNAFGIARPDDLLASLELVFPDAAATLAAYGALP